MLRVIYIIEGFSVDGKRPVVRYARNKKTAGMIVSNYKRVGFKLQFVVRQLRKDEWHWIDTRLVEG